MWRRFVLRMVIKTIRKYFPEGVSAITNSNEDIIGYKWAWSKDVEKEVFGKGYKENQRKLNV